MGHTINTSEMATRILGRVVEVHLDASSPQARHPDTRLLTFKDQVLRDIGDHSLPISMPPHVSNDLIPALMKLANASPDKRVLLSQHEKEALTCGQELALNLMENAEHKLDHARTKDARQEWAIAKDSYDLLGNWFEGLCTALHISRNIGR